MNSNMKKKSLPSEMILGLFVVVIFAVLCAVASGFASVNNIMSILNRFSYILIAAIGMNIIMITGNIDVSFGGVISVMCILMAYIGKTGAPIYVSLHHQCSFDYQAENSRHCGYPGHHPNLCRRAAADCGGFRLRSAGHLYLAGL